MPTRPGRSTWPPPPRRATCGSAGTSRPGPGPCSASTTRCSTSPRPTRASTRGSTGESALLAALNASRTGRMRDIVETIQAEQDLIIRSGLPGVLVVQGGPGTGKTAVALHRAAYLLYTYRRQLEKRGVLVIGPNATFLRYIGQVLPSLGETSVLLATIGDLMPGITATGSEPAGGRADQGPGWHGQGRGRRGARAAARASMTAWRSVSSKVAYRLSRQSLARARERARRSRRPHNQARQIFIREALDELARVVSGRLGADPFGGGNLMGRTDIEDLRAELGDDPEIRAAIGKLWPVAHAAAADRRPVRVQAAARRGRPLADRRRTRDLLRQARPDRRGRPPTCRCSTRRPSCSARTTGPRRRPPGGGATRRRRTPRACSRSSAGTRRTIPRS